MEEGIVVDKVNLAKRLVALHWRLESERKGNLRNWRSARHLEDVLGSDFSTEADERKAAALLERLE